MWGTTTPKGGCVALVVLFIPCKILLRRKAFKVIINPSKMLKIQAGKCGCFYLSSFKRTAKVVGVSLSSSESSCLCVTLPNMQRR